MSKWALGGVSVLLFGLVSFLVKPEINCEKVDRRVSLADQTTYTTTIWASGDTKTQVVEHKTVAATEEWAKGVCRTIEKNKQK